MIRTRIFISNEVLVGEFDHPHVHRFHMNRGEDRFADAVVLVPASVLLAQPDSSSIGPAEKKLQQTVPILFYWPRLGCRYRGCDGWSQQADFKRLGFDQSLV